MPKNIDFESLSFLIVADNAHMRRIVRSLLHGFGSRRVNEAEDGAMGLEAVETHAPDILITDWAMPIFEGLELVQMIRNPDGFRFPYLPIIMLTAHSEKHRVIAARDTGVTEFLTKPISAKSLHSRILNIVLNPRDFVRTPRFFGPDRCRFVFANYSGTERRKGNEGELSEADTAVDEDIFDKISDDDMAEQIA